MQFGIVFLRVSGDTRPVCGVVNEHTWPGEDSGLGWGCLMLTGGRHFEKEYRMPYFWDI